jgi:integrase
MDGVKLRGLKISRARGKYYVYRRKDGEVLLRGFKGDKAALMKRLGEPDMLGLYNAGQKRARKIPYPEKTLGWLVAWFTDPDQCPEFKALSDVTRDEYKDRLGFLEEIYDDQLSDISTADIYEARDRASKKKWPAYADKMVTALSTMFTLATKRRWMNSNPALGVDKVYTPNKNANREWRPEEWRIVMARAPLHLRIAYMLARYAGYRSQSTVAVKWSNYQDDDRFTKCFRMKHKKNSEVHWLPAAPELQAFLADLKKTSPFIAVRYNGEPWRDEEQLQKQSSNFLSKLTKKGLVEPGLTEHGLRATFAAEIKRVTGANDDQVAAALGDRDARMGAHYTRHVEQENKIIFLYATMQWRTRTEQDLENRRAQDGKPLPAQAKIAKLPKRLKGVRKKEGGP